jgi:hypothetical protein
MIKMLLVVCLCFGVRDAFTQAGDFIVIRKKDQTIRTFFNGSVMRFSTVNGEWFDGRVVDIKNDSLFFREVVVRQVPTPWGVSRLDTMTTYIRKVHYSDIAAIPRRSESFGYIKNGTLLMIGGAGYMALNTVNSAYQHYPLFGRDNLPGLIAAAGVFAIGKTMHKLHKPYLVIGKKYTVRYIKA